ncbi:MAG TPA: T9SS type A sorting domain-containing protein, partial [Candidatus Kapabacteria bacterium]|nr:T9SS type A sorting domain-containing protein [Candidatus Kapabacteria bacterium]
SNCHSYLDFNLIDNYNVPNPSLLIMPVEVAGQSVLDLSGAHGDNGDPDYGGYNTIRAYHTSFPGYINPPTMVQLFDATSLINLGNSFATWDWLDYGHNNFYYCESGNCLTTGDEDAFWFWYYGSSIDLGNIDYNFWGYDDNSVLIDPHNGTSAYSYLNWSSTSPFTENAYGITFDYSSTSHTLTAPASKTGITCGGDGEIAGHKGGAHALGELENKSPCDSMYLIGYQGENDGNYTESYDTLKYFMEHCDTDHWALYGFGDMETDVQEYGLGPRPQCWIEFKNWLISVLPLRQDPAWFCADVQALVGSLGTDPEGDTAWADINAGTNAQLAVIRWLLQNPLCATSGDSEAYDGSRGGQWNAWVASVDTNKVKLDTTLPSLHDLGLDSVLKYGALLGVHEPEMESIISNASASPNPAGTGTEIYFTTNREAYVKIDLFNLLGVKLGVTGFEDVLEAGNHEVPISLSGLPSGTYYARIVTTYGEVQTVKLVKE